MAVDVLDVIEIEGDRFRELVGGETGVAVAEADDAVHAIAVVGGQHERADHVVDAGAQAAASDDAAGGRRRVEEQLGAWPGGLE